MVITAVKGPADNSPIIVMIITCKEKIEKHHRIQTQIDIVLYVCEPVEDNAVTVSLDVHPLGSRIIMGCSHYKDSHSV